MKEVIRVIEKDKEDEPVEFTHHIDNYKGWQETNGLPEEFKKVVYLGRCEGDGDMFAAYENGSIVIFKGHLNSGKY